MVRPVKLSHGRLNQSQSLSAPARQIITGALSASSRKSCSGLLVSGNPVLVIRRHGTQTSVRPALSSEESQAFQSVAGCVPAGATLGHGGKLGRNSLSL